MTAMSHSLRHTSLILLYIVNMSGIRLHILHYTRRPFLVNNLQQL